MDYVWMPQFGVRACNHCAFEETTDCLDDDGRCRGVLRGRSSIWTGDTCSTPYVVAIHRDNLDEYQAKRVAHRLTD
jgi:hypothetical protein